MTYNPHGGEFSIRVGSHKIGTGNPCFVIAEAGVNYNGSLKTAKTLIETAARAGACAIKFQTFEAERLVTRDAPRASYQMQGSNDRGSQYDMLKRLELSPEAHQELIAHCRTKGILFLSTPFDEMSADFLEASGVKAFKVPSGEIINLAFLSHLAKKGLPMIVSTGMATLGEVETAVKTIEKAGHRDFVLLHCVSNYPAACKDVNLRAMTTMATAFGAPVGYSDHAPGIAISIAAVALGACVIEKHFTLDRGLPGPDHRASLEPEELRTLVSEIRNTEAALGHGRKEPAPGEADTAAVSRKSLVAARPIPAGTRLTDELIAVKRPGTGLPPAMQPYLIGHTTVSALPEGALFTLEMLK